MHGVMKSSAYHYFLLVLVEYTLTIQIVQKKFIVNVRRRQTYFGLEFEAVYTLGLKFMLL